MTGEQLLIALGGVDDTLLEACEHYRATRRVPWKAMAAAACIALTLILGGVTALHHARLPVSTEPTEPQTTQTGETFAAVYSQETDTEECFLPPSSGTETTRQTITQVNGTNTPACSGSGSGKIGMYDGQDRYASGADEASVQETNTLFEKAPITTKYPTLTWQGKTYMSRGNSDPSAKVQKTVLGSVEVTGFDGAHRTTVSVLPIRSVSQAAAVAVQFADSSRYYTYVCDSFAPATLGEYLDAFSLWDNASFTRVSGVSRKYAATLYPAPSAQTLKNLFDGDAPLAVNVNEYDCPQDMMIDCSMPIFGIKGSSFGVSETGYLVCRLTDSTVIYRIGQDRAKAFLDAVDTGDATHLVPTTGPRMK